MRLSTGMSSLLTANGKDLSVKLVKMGGGLVPMPTRACSNRGMYVRLGIAHTKNLECMVQPSGVLYKYRGRFGPSVGNEILV